jgi:hypothetical protein
MDLHGYTSPYWMTYQQSQKLGGQVPKGEKSTISIYYKSYRAEIADEATGDPRDETCRVLRSYAVSIAAIRAAVRPQSPDRRKDRPDPARPVRQRADHRQQERQFNRATNHDWLHDVVADCHNGGAEPE